MIDRTWTVTKRLFEDTPGAARTARCRPDSVGRAFDPKERAMLGMRGGAGRQRGDPRCRRLRGPAARSMLEAIFVAIPVVTPDVPGCRETVTDRINSRLASTRDARFIDAPDAVVRASAAPQARVLARFSGVNARILVVLRKCLA